MSDHDTHGSGLIDLNLLRTFLAVHRLGSFTAAARLSLSQSTVTTQMRALENRLGHEPFERRAHGVNPLPHADELAMRLSAPLDQLADITGEAPSSTVARPIWRAPRSS
ncbi:LysR family transcriptional regulator [Streptomyces sp. NPDC052101]|uniref:LysR family transcriptional regulator n=1 Tax=Streptomyces sp. NPDC052101 TaxID=3155763 RepID=UPI003411FEB7